MMPADRRAARIGFLISALGGAAGLWINAASVVIAIGLTGVMAVLAAALAGRAGGGLRAQGMVCEPGLWRTWGRWGAAASVVLFLVEQCPDRLLAWRLEINHPLYALAWLGGGELVALALEYLGGARWSAGRWRRAALAAAAVCVVPMVIVIWRERVFVPLDPFVARIHQNIGEFLSLPSRIAELGWRRFLDQTVLRVLLFILAAVTLWRMRRQPVAVLVLSFALAVALPMYAMGWWQMRWMLPASVPQIVLAVAVLDLWLGGAAAAPVKRFRSALVLLTAAVLFVPMPALLVRGWWRTEQQKGVHAGEAMFLLYRDIASTLRSDQPQGRIVLLSNPNASVSMGYFAGLETIGTLYWENQDGLRTAARILTALSAGTPGEVAEAERLVRAHGVTHVVAVAGADFSGAYWMSLRPDEPLPASDQLTSGNAPVWLRPIPYSMPPQFRKRFKLVPRLYAVDFTQTEAEAHYRAGLAALTLLRSGEAERRFDAARIAAPDTPQPWLRLAELRLAAGDAPVALRAMQEGIARSPAAMREQLYIDASRIFQTAGATNEANALLDLAIKAGGGGGGGYLPPPPSEAQPDPNIEALVKQITEQILKKL
ncbi:hypothetical protein Ga0100230_012220 [Opitutaceae bacterium TAV3]|nr:hypothetical protein Ga0100230_012220 [Opitutaceae bacterium TAV3]